MGVERRPENKEKPTEGKILPNEKETAALKQQGVEYRIVKGNKGVVGEYVDTKTNEKIAEVDSLTHSIEYTIKSDGSVLVDFYNKSEGGRTPCPPRCVIRDGRFEEATGIDGMGPGTRYAIIGKIKD